MQSRFIIRFAVLCALAGAGSSLPAADALAQKDRRERAPTVKQERRSQPQSKKESRNSGGAPNKNGGRADSNNPRKGGR